MCKPGGLTPGRSNCARLPKQTDSIRGVPFGIDITFHKCMPQAKMYPQGALKEASQAQLRRCLRKMSSVSSPGLPLMPHLNLGELSHRPCTVVHYFFDLALVGRIFYSCELLTNSSACIRFRARLRKVQPGYAVEAAVAC